MMLVFPVPRSPITSTLYKCSCLPGAAYRNMGRGEGGNDDRRGRRREGGRKEGGGKGGGEVKIESR